jgi:hypothetical protein
MGGGEGAPLRLSDRAVTAFKDELNWIGTGLIVAAGFFAGFPLAIPFAWAAYEAAYMLFVPDSAWYERRLSRRADAEVARRRRDLKRSCWRMLLEEDRERFERLEATRREIEQQQEIADTWVREILRKLDFLLERFLLFATKRAEYLGYLRALAEREEVTPTDMAGRPLPPRGRRRAIEEAGVEALLRWLLEAYDRRVESGQYELARERDPNTRDVLQKNLDVLTRLHANIDQIGQITRNVERQLDLVADSFALINGELRTRPPEQMVSEVESVILSSQALSDALTETASLEQAVQRLGQTP